MCAMTRRQLVAGKRAEGQFPPWASPAFTDDCTRCAKCIEVCPADVIRKGNWNEGGFPVMDFQNDGCDFCGHCVSVCDASALTFPESFYEGREARHQAWSAVAAINSRCMTLQQVICRSCADFCDEQAIVFSTAGVPQPSIDTDACVGCGMCIAGCPSQAIEIVQQGVQQRLQQRVQQRVSE